MGSRVISAVLKLKDQNFSKGLKQANKDAGDFGRYMQAAQNKATQFGQRANDVFKGVGVAAGALISGAIAGLGVAVGQSILEMDSAFAQLQAKTGATGADLANLEDAAKETFSRGYGESLSEVSDAVARVSQNMHEIDASQIGDVASQAMLMAQTFDSDVNEVTRGANNLMQAFGIEADKAFDLFTAGGQRGLNFSNEMFDNVAEYASLFGEMGYSAEEYFGILERGSQKGVYNLNYVNDVMKEFQIRAKDGSKTTATAMGSLSASTQKVWQEYLKGNGTVKDVASTVVNELKGMDDQTKANQIAVGLFGTKFEDLEADAVYAMLGTTEAMKDFEGATDAAAQTVEGSFGNRVKSAFRDLTTSIASLGDSGGGKQALDSIASTAESLVPKITSLASKALEFAGVIANNWKPIATVVASATAAIVAFKVGMAAMSIVNTVVGFIKEFRAATVAGTAAQWAMNVAMSANPIGLVIAGIAALIAIGVALWMNWDTVKAKVGELWAKTKEVFGAIYDWGAEKIGGVTSFFGGLVDKVGEFISRITSFEMPEWVTNVGSTIGKAAGKIKNLLPSFDVGTNRVTQDMTANIHKDEMIIPARQAQKVRAMGGNIDNIDKLINKPSQAVPVASSTTNNQKSAPVIHMTVNANQLSYDDVVYRLSKDIKLALSNM